MAKMRAALCLEPRKLDIVELDRPQPGPGQVVVQVKASGVCGSDVDGFFGTHPWIGYPIVLGHECSGIVDKIGDCVDRFKPGDPVVVEPFSVCEMCPACQRGQYNLCKNIEIIGHGIQGSFAEYICMDERFLHPLPENVSMEEGSLVEPVSGSLHAVGRCNLKIGDFVILMGFGTIGYFTAQHVLNSGARLLVSEQDPRKRDTAKKMGAQFVLDPTRESLEERVLDLTDGVGADCVIEAVGDPNTLLLTTALARKGGKIMLIGWTGKGPVPFDLCKVTLDEMTVLGTMGFAWDFPTSLRLLSERKVDAASIITHRYRLDQVVEAIETLHHKKDGIWKALILFDESRAGL